MIEYKKDKNGFWKQENPVLIEYNEEYKSKQSTTKEMSWLRLGVFISVLSFKELKELNNWKICDVGSGNGKFVKESKIVFGTVKEYDLSGNTISKEELYNTEWDLIVLTDVLEHFENIDDLFKIKFNYLFLSFPETPIVDDFHKLENWKHYKPNEHLYCLNSNEVMKWLSLNGYDVVYNGNCEDIIRKSSYNKNISTIICKKKIYR